jgi:hypothetical protein
MATEATSKTNEHADLDKKARAAAHYLHDRKVLLLLSINVFLALLVIVSVLFRLEGSATSGGYIVQYRPSLGISAFKTGSSAALYAFIAFAILVVGLHTSLSMRLYGPRKKLAVTVLGMGSLLLVLALIVSNALLALD